MSWKLAFARQAQSDLRAREVLMRTENLPACHQLHFLQMACEKLSKAYLIAGGSDPIALQSSHAYVAKQIPIITRQFLARTAKQVPRETGLVKAVRKLAREIEQLAPIRPNSSNTEYPWRQPDGSIIAPVDYAFDPV